MFDLIEKTLLDNLPGTVKRSSTGWFKFNAPCCSHNNETSDNRGRGNLLISGDGSIVYNCYNCKFKTGWRYGNKFLGNKFKEFMTWLNIPDNIIRDLELKTKIEFYENIPDNYVKKYIKLSFSERSLPKGSVNILDLLNDEKYLENTDFLDMLVYLHSRGERLSNLNNYYWTPNKESGWNRRILIPFYWENKLVGFTGRSFDNKPKYRYFSDMQSNYIFNTEAIKPEHKYIFVVEGPFDALAINGIATLGDKCSDSQVEWIKQTAKFGKKEIIVIPDQEKSGGQLLKIAKENEWYVSFPKWDGCKDAAEATKMYGYIPTVQSILTRRYNTEHSIEAMKNILLKGI